MFSKLKKYKTASSVTGSIEYIVAGLGNPGREYEKTRHNAGFMAIDYIADKENLSMKQLKFKSLCEDGAMAGKRVLFMKPSTYMNKSGEAIRDAMNFYKVPPEKLIVICDDIDLAVGKMRIRRKGSDGGQKGLENIIYHIADNKFPRIRLGIGSKPYPNMDLADWVLSKFTTEDMGLLDKRFPDVYKAVELILSENINEAMNLFN